MSAQDETKPTDPKKTQPQATEARKVFVVKQGGQNIDEKCYAMAHVMCSMSSSQNGCGAVFWAESNEFKRGTRSVVSATTGQIETLDGGWLIECPDCGRIVGGLDVEFKTISGASFLKRFGFDIEQNKTEYFAGQLNKTVATKQPSTGEAVEQAKT